MAHLPTSVPANFSTVVYGEQNNTTNTTCPDVEFQHWQITVLAVCILFMAVLGIVLNVFVLMVFCLHNKACTIAEIYLTNMAAADLLLMAFLPFWAVYVIKKYHWPFAHPLCKLVTFSINMNSYCSIYFLVLISIDRYVALVQPLSYERIRRPKYAKLGCMAVWCFGLLLNVPTLVFREVGSNPNSNSSSCYLNYPNLTVLYLFEVMLITFGFIIPISTISFCTFRIIQALNNRIIVGLNTKKVEQKATTLMLVVLLAFMICWVPFHLVQIVWFSVYARVLTNCTFISILVNCEIIFWYLALFNSVLNPILYVLVGKNFRKKVRELFKQWSINRTTTLSTTSTHFLRS